MMIGKLGMAYLGITDTDSTDPGISNVLEDVGYVIDGVAKTGVYHPASVNEVKYGITFGPNGSLIGNFPPFIVGTSFKTVMENLKTVLENDPHLSAFCIEKWGKPLNVKTIFKKRAELSIQSLPKILITRPDIKKSFLTNTNRNGVNTVRLYCGFQQNDRQKGSEELIEFEEKIDDALIAQEPGTLGALNIIPKESINDEGEWHPVYFMVLDVEILHRR